MYELKRALHIVACSVWSEWTLKWLCLCLFVMQVLGLAWTLFFPHSRSRSRSGRRCGETHLFLSSVSVCGRCLQPTPLPAARHKDLALLPLLQPQRFHFLPLRITDVNSRFPGRPREARAPRNDHVAGLCITVQRGSAPNEWNQSFSRL